MPIQNSPPARKTRSHARAQAVLTQTTKAPLDGTPEVPQLRAHLDRGPNVEGRKRTKKNKLFFRSNGEEEAEDSDGTEGVPAPVGESQGTEGPTIAKSNQLVSHQSRSS
ncbi:hypothetical protein O181_028183 [Austropuccinia psidii MF-1]|uniref:Uncharacterized protein n=1 Tax=Austropuccinia psidii MF-1 TaxID=1389203 RepID=A0A9Q3H1K2_9BASI|nr:hypothetical protein [Austropuccinia psidii MF-1]